MGLGVALLLACDPSPKPPAGPGYLPNATPSEVKAKTATSMELAAATARAQPKRKRPKPPSTYQVPGKRHLAFPPATKLPNFTIVQRGQPLPLAGVRQKPMLLHLWASWCGPCVKELPDILAFGRKGLVDVVAVSVDDHWPLVQKYFKNDIPREVAWDPAILLEPGLGVRSLPTTFLVDSKGFLRIRWNGLQAWNTKEMAQTIMTELAHP